MSITNQYIVVASSAPTATVWSKAVGTDSTSRYSLDGTQVIVKLPVGFSLPDPAVTAMGGTQYDWEGIRAHIAANPLIWGSDADL
jgi:hypothetical protein